MIRAVSFDAVGTLITPVEPVGATYARVAARFGIGLDPREAEAGFRHGFAAAPPLAFPGLAPAELGDAERAWWRALVATAFGDAARHAAFAECFDALFAHYAGQAAWRVYDDVRPALEGLRHRRLRLGVVSNFDGRLPGILTGLGLLPLFDAVVCSSRAGAAKPDARVFAAAAGALGVPLAALHHVGDDDRADVGGASAAGARATHLDRTGRAPGAIRDLTGLGPRIEGAR